MSMTGIVWSLGFFLLFFAVGILIVVLGVRQIRDGLGARSWPRIDAALEKCEVATRVGNGVITYHVAVQYTYAVAGVRYAGTTLAIGAGGRSDRTPAETAQRRVLAMNRFMIRYNPDQPDMAAIFLSTKGQIFSIFFMGVFWLILTTCITSAIFAMSGGFRLIGRWMT